MVRWVQVVQMVQVVQVVQVVKGAHVVKMVQVVPFQLLEYQTELRRCRFPHRYKPGSLLRPYIANTSAVAT